MEASPSPQQQQQQQQQQEKEEEVHVSAPPKITYSITQHYHHSSHLVQPPTAPQPPPQSTATPRYNATANWVNRILGHNGIEPSSLTPGQLELFANAMPEQQSRLIQIWQICPQPSRNAQSLPSSSHFPSAGAFDMHMHDSMVPERDGRDGDDEAQGYAEPYMISGYGLGGQESAAHKAAPLATEPSTGFPYRLSNDPIYQTPGQRWWERTQAGSMEY
ncbi:hypothetical protein P175DRAFT_0502734 [Aspergillus ochraceoroseus IBT 24754]|uniref:Uncharacterized protein n=2 Tax=Aspergillus ochraceoroseus TaxID=138278 RepID=A0A2T5LSG0_9EURO|nr:uncharacterized protein P175DRAFT_0502734 [Aspergillus ochraceoroseus IBT 24754]KKK26126.1 hypothetical protein AOCH_005375 [Aspergillus ochraceoroseus]PTU19211.1 hypothetical protein P175DRAFT_0502734 [Aspergillus ochraceoroseus IBT 24754]